MIGRTLSHYTVLEELGRGGMGIVYRARDTKLGREVAIKVLPEEFAQHPQKLARFEREARLLAATNHPGIATLYGVEESEGKPFLVMELVEGETLAERIARGPLPVNEALTLSQQIAEAVEAAHEKGVIHRDLKPSNIKVDAEGHVKVLDFGLAKAFAEEVPESELSASPTLSREATRAGVILGTAAYMSPEQAKGKEVDKRTDIFSFGIVLYEMLTGKKAFPGKDVSDVLARILAVEPNWEVIPRDLDPRIQSLLRRCFTKDRKNRLQAIGDVRVEIQEILAGPTGAPVQPPLAVSAPSRKRERIAWGLVAALVVGIAIWSVTRSAQPPRPVARFSLALPPGDALTGANRHAVVALSPDGTRLVYSANQQLYLRALDQTVATPVRGTEGGACPFFSSDSEWVGFYATHQIKKVAIRGGTPVNLCETSTPFGARWGADNTIVFGQAGVGIMRVSADGGLPEVLVPLEGALEGAGEVGHGPQVLPDEKAVLYTFGESSNWDTARIVAHSLESGETKVLIERGRDARYVPTGHLVYVLDGTLLAVAFDVDRLEVKGGAVPMAEGVMTAAESRSGAAQFSVSDNGSLVYVAGAGQEERRLVWVDREGREEAVEADPLPYDIPRVSPDGSRVAVELEGSSNFDIHVFDLERHTLTRLTFDPGYDAVPLWTPDGQAVVFRSSRGGGGLFKKAADGTGEVERLTTNPNNQVPSAWSGDGNTLVFYETKPTGSSSNDIYTLSLEGEQSSELLLHKPFLEEHPAVSPDGRWIAYTSRESGEDEIYVHPFPNVEDGRWQVSTSGGTEPVWGPDGRELFYVIESQTADPSAIMVVPVTLNPTFRPGNPNILFEGNYLFPLTGRHYDIAPDGQRFLMLKPVAQSDEAPAQIVLVQNWFQELERLVPTK